MDYVWRNIKLHAGEKFHTKTGVEFSYHIRNDYIVLENTNRSIPRKHIYVYFTMFTLLYQTELRKVWHRSFDESTTWGGS